MQRRQQMTSCITYPNIFQWNAFSIIHCTGINYFCTLDLLLAYIYFNFAASFFFFYLGQPYPTLPGLQHYPSYTPEPGPTSVAEQQRCNTPTFRSFVITCSLYKNLYLWIDDCFFSLLYIRCFFHQCWFSIHKMNLASTGLAVTYNCMCDYLQILYTAQGNIFKISCNWP